MNQIEAPAEVWIDIKDFEGLYQISNLGNVKSLAKSKTFPSTGQIQHSAERILKLNKTGRNREYLQIHLNKNNKRYRKYVHRLVASHFCEGYFDGAQVNHIDCNKGNNESSNLEWVTASENIIHAHKNGLITMPAIRGSFKLTDADLLKIEGMVNKREKTCKEIGQCFGVSATTISRVMKERGVKVNGKKRCCK